MGKYSRLNEHNFRVEVIPTLQLDLQVTSAIALAFHKADRENMGLLFCAFPLVCLDYFCWYNYNHNASVNPTCTARALVQIQRDSGLPFDYDYSKSLMRLLDFSEYQSNMALWCAQNSR